jgi:hypothetical protein
VDKICRDPPDQGCGDSQTGAQLEADLAAAALSASTGCWWLGRRAQSDGLGLEATWVRLTERGRFVQVTRSH